MARMTAAMSASGNVPARPWAALLVAALVSVLFGCIACTGDSETGGDNPRDAYYNLMVEGWLQGKTSLSLEAPAGLVALADPYDPKANITFRGSLYYPPRVHDLSYHKGKLYAYFSPVPALVAFLPYRVLTGHWLSHQRACLFFCLVEFWGAVLLVLSARDRFFPGVGNAAVAAVVPALGFLSLGPVLLERADVWEVPAACAQAAWMLAILAAWRLWFRPRAHWLLWLPAGTLAALAAGSRPSGALCAVILLFPAWRLLREGGAGAAARAASLSALVLPLAAVAAGLLAFNRARFGEWLEFGQRYQLNGEVGRHASSGYFSPGFFAYNLRLYALHAGDWAPHFPFIRAMVFPPAPPGYRGGDHPFGLIPCLPATLFAAALAVSWRAVPAPRRRDFLALTGMVACAGLAAAAPLLLFYSACLRYEFEFALFPAILAGVGYLGAEALARGWGRAAVRCAWGLAVAASGSFCLLLVVWLRAQSLAEHGRVDVLQANRPAALEHLQAALTLEPGLVAARATLGTLHLRDGDFKSAADDYARAVREVPDSAVLLANYGYCLLRLGRDEQANAIIARAVKVDPADPAVVEVVRLAGQRQAQGKGAGPR
jgi:tetratricopeptide (TPR) repeat protein